MGKVQAAVAALIKENGEPVGTDAALGELALVIAKAIDDTDTAVTQLPNLSKELRLALKQLQEGQTGGEDDEWGDLASPE